MTRWKRWVARTVSEGRAVGLGLRGPRPGFRILLYHAIGSRVAADTYGFSVPRERFAQHMRALRQRRDAAGVALDAAAGAGLRVAVTFDDGFKDTLTAAAPTLVQYRIPCTVFVTPALLGSSPDYLTPGELRELASLPGVRIGSHGLTHVRLTGCTDAQLERELRDSRRALEDLVGRAVSMLSYPHGAVDARVRQAAVAAGYLLGACSRAGINDAARDPLLLCRTEIVGADTMRAFSQKLEGAWDWTRRRSPDPAVMTERLN